MSTPSRVAAVALLVIAGCGGEDGDGPEGEAAPVRDVTGSVELPRPAGGPPDAGTARGHGADLAVAATSRPSLRVRGEVSPADADVSLQGPRGGRSARAQVGPDGRFTVTARALWPGLNEFRLEGRKAGRRPWRLDLRITRRP